MASRWLKGLRRRLRVGEKGRKWMIRGMVEFQGELDGIEGGSEDES